MLDVSDAALDRGPELLLAKSSSSETVDVDVIDPLEEDAPLV